MYARLAGNSHATNAQFARAVRGKVTSEILKYARMTDAQHLCVCVVNCEPFVRDRYLEV